ncbi:hypothetical protein A1QO_04055 [Vibrio genomosp. F10 str. ZF-129]|uniref:Uncharacterized protein n=1 Tax=Vibrio genomosp. F10 str. ZF-129 TaxID=1187848 RepID=A0A1E5BIL0_9VIBR|nr:hypothetical protein [Vibrio genomosp. F10]OEE37285.1 hypothetical protein A1QO_04055 [Vibrio genomosp. F10 str. ZF-129]
MHYHNSIRAEIYPTLFPFVVSMIIALVALIWVNSSGEPFYFRIDHGLELLKYFYSVNNYLLLKSMVCLAIIASILSFWSTRVSRGISMVALSPLVYSSMVLVDAITSNTVTISVIAIAILMSLSTSIILFLSLLVSRVGPTILALKKQKDQVR